MGDDSEGDVPYQGLFCECGLRHIPHKPRCPDCDRPWPESLKARWPYDGGPEIRTEPGKHEDL